MKVGFSVFGFALDCTKNKELKWSENETAKKKRKEKKKNLNGSLKN